MKRIAQLATMLSIALLAGVPSQAKSSPLIDGKVVNVVKYEEPSPGDALTTPTDAPLISRSYAYDISVKVDCDTYTGRYETAFQYLPRVFRANEPVEVRVTKHVLYLDIPNGPEVRTPIVRRTQTGGEGCRTSL
jgi:hypothetical protein